MHSWLQWLLSMEAWKIQFTTLKSRPKKSPRDHRAREKIGKLLVRKRSDIVDTDFDETDETCWSAYQLKFSWETSEIRRSKNHPNLKSKSVRKKKSEKENFCVAGVSLFVASELHPNSGHSCVGTITLDHPRCSVFRIRGLLGWCKRFLVLVSACCWCRSVSGAKGLCCKSSCM